MTHDTNTAPSPTTQLLRLDRDLTKLLIRRSQLLAQTAQQRHERKQSLVDPGQEKRLWGLWQKTLQENGIDPRHWRHIFQSINGLAYHQAERTPDRLLTLYPSTAAVAADIPGPPDTATARLWLTAAIASGQKLRLNAVVANDPFHEFVTALNHAGAGLSKEEDRLLCPEAAGVEFGGTTVHAGTDPLNLALAMMASLPEPGNTKITGGSHLRLEDLTPATELFARLGARLVFLTPGSNSVPLRMERSGQVPSELDYPETAPPTFLAALLVASLRFTRPFSVRWHSAQTHHPHVGQAIRILEHAGAVTAKTATSLSVDPTHSRLPGSISIPLDPIYNAFLLALPHVKGGSVRLQGRWETSNPNTQAVLELLKASGLSVEQTETAVHSTLAEDSGAKRLEATGAVLPLATVLSVYTAAKLQVENAAERRAVVLFLEQIGCPFQITDDGLQPGVPGKKPELPFAAETPEWGMASALYALKFGPIQFTNPGEITSVWPAFWRVVRNLPQPQLAAQRPKSEAPENAQPRRRRIVK
ncbi:MAG: hypothetical protein ACQESV_06455 [Thermodesulfobacteriota bacterium]